MIGRIAGKCTIMVTGPLIGLWAQAPDYKKRQKKMKCLELSEFIPAGAPAVDDYPDNNKDNNNDSDDEENPAR